MIKVLMIGWGLFSFVWFVNISKLKKIKYLAPNFAQPASSV